MAHEPVIRNQADLLNHVRRTLDKTLQRWEWVIVGHLMCDVHFLGTGRTEAIWFSSGTFYSSSPRVQSLLRGDRRDDSGRMVGRVGS